jgi:hypothetical protein
MIQHPVDEGLDTMILRICRARRQSERRDQVGNDDCRDGEHGAVEHPEHLTRYSVIPQ